MELSDAHRSAGTEGSTAAPDRPSMRLVGEQREIANLIAAAVDGSIGAFEKLIMRYQDRLYNFLRHRVADEHEAEDITQETFVRAWQQLARYDDRWAFSTWLFTIAARLAIDAHRHNSRRLDSTARATSLDASPSRRLRTHAHTGIVSNAPGLVEPSSSDAEPSEQIAQQEASSNAWHIAENLLNARERAALWLCYAEDMSPCTIARVLDMTSVAVRVMLHRARQRLAAHMQTKDSMPDQKQLSQQRHGTQQIREVR